MANFPIMFNVFFTGMALNMFVNFQGGILSCKKHELV